MNEKQCVRCGRAGHDSAECKWLSADDAQDSLAPGYPRVDVGLGKFAIGPGICRVSNNPVLMFLRLDEPREVGADTTDVYPVGVEASKDRIAAAIHFHNAKAVQRIIDELLGIQRDHYHVGESVNQQRAGVYRKFNVSRTDGRDLAGGDRHGAEYFVLDVTHDRFAKPALAAYAAACRGDYPSLSDDMVRRYGIAQPPASTGLHLNPTQVAALREVLRISDRQHDAWETLKVALKGTAK